MAMSEISLQKKKKKNHLKFKAFFFAPAVVLKPAVYTESPRGLVKTHVI